MHQQKEGFISMKKSRTDPPSSARTAQHVPEDNEHSRTATSGALRLRFLALRHQYWWVYELLLELCNYLDRTRTLISHRATPMIHTGHLYGVDHQGQTIQCSRTLGRTQDIQDWRYHDLAPHVLIARYSWKDGTRDRDIPNTLSILASHQATRTARLHVWPLLTRDG